MRDIEERTLEYGLRAVRLYRHLQTKKDGAAWIVGKQFLRSATSIGANVSEAQSGETKADFVHKYAIAQKESRESKYWLNLMQRAEMLTPEMLRPIIQETTELHAIITRIIVNAKRRK